MGYLYLALATAGCIAGSSFLTASDGMTRKVPAVIGVILFVLCYVLFARCIMYMNLSIAYAIFCGAGIVVSGLISAFVFKQKITKIGVACMALILVACVYIHLFGSM